jgi:hypothetical protein
MISMNICRCNLLLREAESLSHSALTERFKLAYMMGKRATSKALAARGSGSRVNVRVMTAQISTFSHVVTV